jgi:hypothetical protein
MQHGYDNLAIALGIVASLGCLWACFFFVYHSAMIAICLRRITPPDQRTLSEYVRILPNAAKLHLRKALKGLLAFFICLLLVVVTGLLLSN